MVLPGDPRHQFETQRLLEIVSQPDQFVICCYERADLIDIANHAIRDLLGAIVREVKRNTLVLENGTTIRLILDSREAAETRGRHSNYFIIR